MHLAGRANICHEDVAQMPTMSAVMRRNLADLDRYEHFEAAAAVAAGYLAIDDWKIAVM